MKILIDFFPILLFFGAYKMFNIYTATGVLMAATVLQMGLIYAIDRKLQAMHKITLVLILLFGTLTLVLQDDRFIKWKPTVLYWLMGGALLIGQLVFRKNFIKSLMGAQMQLPDAVWRTLNWSWTGFFAVMGLVNLWVAYTFDTDTWVNFKLFGGIGLMFAFVIAQALYLGRFIKDDEDAAPKDAQP